MNEFFIGFILCFIFYYIFESLMLRYIYFSNLDLFFAIVVGKKNKEKLRNYFMKEEEKNGC